MYENTMTRSGIRRVAIYCRVSTASDLQDGSFEVQMNYYRNQVNANPEMVLVDVYGDHGKSGTSIEGRPEFKRMLADCKCGKIDLILTKSISRFARNMADCISTIRYLKELGVAVNFEKEGFHTDGQYSELLLSILASIAEEESNSIGRNRDWAEKRRHLVGQTSVQTSYGYRRVMPDYQWKIEKSEARRVRLAFHMACCGYNYEDILHALQSLEDEEHTGKKWKHGALIYMLSNVSYTGDLLTNKHCTIVTEQGKKLVENDGFVDQYYFESHHEPIVNHSIFEAVQELIEQHLLYKRKRYSDDDIITLENACRLSTAAWGRLKIPGGAGINADEHRTQ